jgi:hypothetical protein
MRTRATTSRTSETIPTDQASLRAVHVLTPSPRPGLCATEGISKRAPDALPAVSEGHEGHHGLE